ncbi:DUF4240 domain-containing protein [Oscillibacter sp. 1-3]|uniref:DUF4240 domain-containing protein n=1 Tax=Oscillibacter sp. 1-3 TaxID=1235797 RepID=UPI00033C37C7|nr:DUF4240 domain-containing protein [Oscillibacter sp. 1-3]EOS63763.1 hypothetical protein C816_03537 [Oscillibacter sp. 1-3]
MEMTKDGFWDLIAEAKKRYGQDQDGSFQWLKDQLTILGPQQAQDFHDILHGYQQLANQYGLWSAAILICEHGCTDDGFIDFRAWLIAQGREVYLAALADPDSLAEVEAYGGCQFEELTDTGNTVLETLTGQSAYEGTDLAACNALAAELRQDIAYGGGIGYPCEWDELEAHFPRLCAKYLEPGTVESMLETDNTIWYSGSPDIQKARAGGPPQLNMNMEGM